MRLSRTVPGVLLTSAAIYIPVVVLRNSLPAMSWEAAIGLSHAAVARFVGFGLLTVATLGAMVWSRIPAGDFGFRRAKGSWLRFAAGGALTGFVSTLLVKASGAPGLDAALADVSPGGIACLLILATCVEELFVRGWMQGCLLPLQDRRLELAGISLSTPVTVCALAFGAMHLSLISSGIDLLTVACVLAFTTTLGLLAGLAREKTGGLLPAIGTHLAGNIGGIAGGILYAIATAAAHAR